MTFQEENYQVSQPAIPLPSADQVYEVVTVIYKIINQ